jgi:hypothetical protein
VQPGREMLHRGYQASLTTMMSNQRGRLGLSNSLIYGNSDRSSVTTGETPVDPATPLAYAPMHPNSRVDAPRGIVFRDARKI